MYSEDPGARRTLAENIQIAHKLASVIEQGLSGIDGTLHGAGPTNAAGAAAPSCGLLGDVVSLVSRLEHIAGNIDAINANLSQPSNVIGYPSEEQGYAKADYVAAGTGLAAGQLMGGDPKRQYRGY